MVAIRQIVVNGGDKKSVPTRRLPIGRRRSERSGTVARSREWPHPSRPLMINGASSCVPEVFSGLYELPDPDAALQLGIAHVGICRQEDFYRPDHTGELLQVGHPIVVLRIVLMRSQARSQPLRGGQNAPSGSVFDVSHYPYLVRRAWTTHPIFPLRK